MLVQDLLSVAQNPLENAERVSLSNSKGGPSPISISAAA
jgi:hypothetical protein